VETNRSSNVLIRRRPLPNVDTVLAVVVIGYLHMVQPRRPADLRQHLGLDLLRMVRHRNEFFLVRGSLLGLFHYLIGLVKGAGMIREPHEQSSDVKRREKLRAIRKSKSPLNGISFFTPRSTITILTASGDDGKGNGLWRESWLN